jgi:hypothetical protein
MCMSKVNKIYGGIGYKVVRVTDEFFSPLHQQTEMIFDSTGWNFSKPYKPYKEYNPLILCNDNKEHVPGFHVFKTKTAAIKYQDIHFRNTLSKTKIIKVRYQGIIAEGLQQRFATVITPAFKILEVVKV